MARRYYTNPDAIDYYRRPGRSLPVNISHPIRETPRVQPTGTRAIHPTSPYDTDSDRNQQPRRRIAVACSRCRKRKIKCSGDPGNGQSCLNCKNAGTDPSSCQFLRVNSIMPCGYAPELQWPYQMNGLASRPSLTSHAGNMPNTFPPNSASSMPSYSSISFPGVAASTRAQYSAAYPNLPFSTMPHRSDFNYSSSSLDGGFDAYSIPSVQPALQHQDFQMSTSLYGNSEAARQWPALGQQNRSGNSYDQDLALKYSSSGLNYGDTGFSSALSSADTPSLFPNMGNLASTLPIHPRNNDRVLPNPRSALLSSTNDTITGAHTLMIEDIVPPVSQRRGIKSSSLWSAERLEGGGSLTPTSAESSCAAAYAVPHVINKPSDSPPESHQTSFGYMTHTPPTTSTTPTTESDSTKPSSCVPMIENLLSASSAYDSGLSNDNLLRRDFSSSSLYTYSTGNGSRCDSQSSFSEATLLNGQPYISQLRQPHHQHAENCDIARRNSSEIAARDSHRASTASIASIGSSRR